MIFEKKTSKFFYGTGYRLYSDHEIKIIEWHVFVCWQWNSREWRRLVNVNCEHAHNSSSKWARPGDRLHCAFQVPSRARPSPSLPLPTGLGPPESSTGPSPLNTFTLPTFLPSRARPGSSPLDLWQCKRGLSFSMSNTALSVYRIGFSFSVGFDVNIRLAQLLFLMLIRCTVKKKLVIWPYWKQYKWNILAHDSYLI